MDTLASNLKQRFESLVDTVKVIDMVTVELSSDNLLELSRCLRDEAPFSFDTLIDICGVDYLSYGMSDWRTEEATSSGFSRGVLENPQKETKWCKPRFASVYHLLSVTNNQRLRLKVYLDEEPIVSSVIDIWATADWFEREAYDLFGIVYDGHPDLRRLLTDYGFVGHPFRKDFPLIGEVELRYDAAKQCCVYEPVSIQPRVLVPKVIRQDNRYSISEVNEDSSDA